MTRNFTRAEAQRETGPYSAPGLDQLESATRAALVQGMGMDESTVAAIVGPPNAGKTAFAVSLGVSFAARAHLWLGRKIMPGSVCYFAAEAPGSVTMRAKAAASRARCRGSHFHICKAVPGLGGKGTTKPDTDRVIATVLGLNIGFRRVKLIFLDTVAAVMGDGNENAEGMMLLVAAARRIALETQACVVLIHHPSKGDPTGERGHGSLKGTCDAIIHIDIENEQTGVRTATLTKARDDASGLQLRFELDVVTLREPDRWGDPQTTIVVKLATQAKPRPQPKTAHQQELLAELERRYLEGETTWETAALRKLATDELGMHRNTARRTLKALYDDGFIDVGASTTLRVLSHPPSGENK
jgi:RecA-family ATPase